MPHLQRHPDISGGIPDNRIKSTFFKRQVGWSNELQIEFRFYAANNEQTLKLELRVEVEPIRLEKNKHQKLAVV